MPIEVRTSSETRFVDYKKNATVAEMLHEAGISLDLQCSGLGICGKCSVELLSGDFCLSGHMKKNEELPCPALACQTEICGETAVIAVPDNAILRATGKIHDDFDICAYTLSPLTRKLTLKLHSPTLAKPHSDAARLEEQIRKYSWCGNRKISWCHDVLQKAPSVLSASQEITLTLSIYDGIWKIVAIEEKSPASPCLGAAVDIGTTTVAVALLDMETGKILAKASSYNQQMSLADDVASRISAAFAGADRLQYLQKLIVQDTINKLFQEACAKAGMETNRIYRAAFSGNTVMLHLFLGLSPESIGKLPFQPLTNIYENRFASEIGLAANPNAVLDMLPCASGYIGGDVTADIKVTGLMETQELTALIDLGTNSEMVLADKGKLFACAAAAGPAFEGAGMWCGSRAVSGAIEHIDFDAKLDFKLQIIDNTEATGICGSAAIDFIANAFKCGLVNQMGRYDVEMLKARGRYLLADICGVKYHACLLAENNGKQIFITERDIEQLLKAKAAVYSGLQTLLALRGHNMNSLKKILLAGGFAKYINIRNAISIGMLPEIAETITEQTGNTSLAGAYLNLIDETASASYLKIIEKPEIISLNTVPGFEDNFIDALMLPNCNSSDFPKTMSTIKEV